MESELHLLGPLFERVLPLVKATEREHVRELFAAADLGLRQMLTQRLAAAANAVGRGHAQRER